MNSLHVLVVDDHPIFRKGLVTMLQQDHRVREITEAGDGEEALRHVRRTPLDLSFLDLSMPGKNGLETLEEISVLRPNLKVVVLTATRNSRSMRRAFSLGALGFMLKADTADNLFHCMDTVLEQSVYISPGMGEDSSRAESSDLEKLSLLTPAECRVLALVGRFLTSREIAERLHVSHRTVQNHRTNISRKLDIQGMHHLTRFAVKHLEWLNRHLENE